MTKPHKTTRKDFERFQAEFTWWQERLGLTEWRCVFKHVRLDDCYGDISTNHEGRVATVRLSLEIPADLPKADPVRTARHEALELLLADLGTLASYRYIRYDEIYTARHAVIRRIENLLDEKADGRP